MRKIERVFYQVLNEDNFPGSDFSLELYEDKFEAQERLEELMEYSSKSDPFKLHIKEIKTMDDIRANHVNAGDENEGIVGL